MATNKFGSFLSMKKHLYRLKSHFSGRNLATCCDNAYPSSSSSSTTTTTTRAIGWMEVVVSNWWFNLLDGWNFFLKGWMERYRHACMHACTQKGWLIIMSVHCMEREEKKGMPIERKDVGLTWKKWDMGNHHMKGLLLLATYGTCGASGQRADQGRGGQVSGTVVVVKDQF